MLGETPLTINTADTTINLHTYSLTLRENTKISFALAFKRCSHYNHITLSIIIHP